ncbi:MAG: hypothetical protein H7Z73_07560 [Candidatus Saccharibacteria bacterium]|nr:hypothetical protein [Moraxellaceae bacterium]
MNTKKSRKNTRSFTLSAFPMVAMVVLTGCGSGGTNNLADPSVNTGNKIVSCSASGAVACVTNQFVVDAPVVGLNYQCGIVNDVTDTTGTVICPDKSVAVFSLQGKDRTRSITLGSYLVKSKRDTSGAATKTLVRITPLDLAPAALDAPSLTDTAAMPALNIAQILESLRSKNSSYTPDSPTSRLIIDDFTKEKINLLAASISAADVASGSFVTAFQPVLTSLNVSLLPQDQVVIRLMQALQAIQAGSYYTNPLFISFFPDITSTQAASIATIATSARTDDQSVLGLANIIDRSGNAIGHGAEWNGDISPIDSTKGTKTAYNLLTGANGYTRLLPTSPTTFINPVNGFVKTNYIWQPKAYKLDATSNLWTETGVTPTPLGQATFSKGRLLSGTYIVGNQPLWTNVTNNPTTVLAPANELGIWSQTNSATSKPYSGTLTLQKPRSVDTFLDPSVFKTAANVGKDNQAIFPLYAVLTFSYLDANKVSKEIGKQGIKILANGNIETDMAQNCQASSAVEYPVGMVAAAFQGVTNISDRFISPIIMLSGQQFGQLDGMQIGTIGFSRSAKINVVAATRGSINMTDNTDVFTTNSDKVTTLESTGEQSVLPAGYTNFYDFWSNIKSADLQTAADKVAALRSVGSVSLALNTCYTPPIGQ